MDLEKILKKENKIVLGIEIGINSFCAALVKIDKVTHILDAFEEEFQEQDMGNFLLLADKIVFAVAQKGWQFSEVALATGEIREKQLSLRDISAKEMQEIILHEMETTWDADKNQYVAAWRRKEKNSTDVLVGILHKNVLDNCRYLAQKLHAKLSAITCVKTVAFSENLVFDKGYSSQEEKENLEKNFCGAIYASLVAGNIKNDLNFCDVISKKQNANLPRYYKIGTKILTGVFAFFLAVSGIFYGVSCYKLAAVKKQINAVAQWGSRYDKFLELNNKYQQYKNIYDSINKNYFFRTGHVEMILDCLPEFNAEIFTLKDIENKETKYLELDGAMGNMADLQTFINDLKATKIFAKVNLKNNKTLPTGELGFELQLQYEK